MPPFASHQESSMPMPLPLLATKSHPCPCLCLCLPPRATYAHTFDHPCAFGAFYTKTWPLPSNCFAHPMCLPHQGSSSSTLAYISTMPNPLATSIIPPHSLSPIRILDCFLAGLHASLLASLLSMSEARSVRRRSRVESLRELLLTRSLGHDHLLHLHHRATPSLCPTTTLGEHNADPSH